MIAPGPFALVLGAAAGAAVGVLHFWLLWLTVRMHARCVGPSRVVPLHLLRFAVTVGVFWLVAHQGALPLLLALAGFLIARSLTQSRLAAE